MANGSLIKVESIAELPLEHSAILLTYMVKVINGLENQFLVFLVLDRFYCFLPARANPKTIFVSSLY